MKQTLTGLIILVLLLALIAVLSAITFVQKEKMPDSESIPNRSTYNAGATGTRAFYTFLAETGRSVVRWQEPFEALLTERVGNPAVLIIAGPLKRDIENEEAKHLLRWVAEGGRLIVIDREPIESLLVTTSHWTLSSATEFDHRGFSVDPADSRQMIAEAEVGTAVQPTSLVAGINAVQPSIFASSIYFKPKDLSEDESTDETATIFSYETPPPVTTSAPTVHLAAESKNLVVDAPYGDGTIVFVSDPFILSNGGIRLVDNVQLGVNLASVVDGIVAFDEYHHGYGADRNRFLQFFSGTPIIPIFLQMFLLAAFVLFSQSRRFARPVPEPEPNRLSKLEYVEAMAELQRRTRSFDLALENLYSDFHRRVTRELGLNGLSTNRDQIAEAIEARCGIEKGKTVALLSNCESIIHGEPTTKKEVLQIAAEFRSIEAKLGLLRGKGGRG